MVFGFARWMAAGSAALAVSACTTLPSAPQVPRLPGGDVTAMTYASNGERAAIVVFPVPLREPATYRPVGECRYVRVQSGPNGDTLTEPSTLTIRRNRGRLLITMNARRGPSTALIGPGGELYNFNLLSSDGRRRTPQNSSQLLRAVRNTQSRAGRPTTRVLDDFTTLFPRYTVREWTPGQTVADVADESGQPWGSYVYRGTTTRTGIRAVVLDLKRPLSNMPQYDTVVVGYLVADIATMAPLLFVLDAGWTTRIERVGCR